MQQTLTIEQEKEMQKIFSSELIASEELDKYFNRLLRFYHRLFWMQFSKQQINELYERAE